MGAEKNVRLATTNLTGREAEDIMADFEFSEEGRKVIKCPGGHEPKSCSYNQETDQCTISFQKSQCQNCPHKKQATLRCLNGWAGKQYHPNQTRRRNSKGSAVPKNSKSKAVFGMECKPYPPCFANNTELIQSRYAN